MAQDKLHPEVRQMVNEGSLSQMDADWIQNLPLDKQVAAAMKMRQPNFSPVIERTERSRMGQTGNSKPRGANS